MSVSVSAVEKKKKKKRLKLSRLLFSGSNVYKIICYIAVSYDVYTGKMKASAQNMDEQQKKKKRNQQQQQTNRIENMRSSRLGMSHICVQNKITLGKPLCNYLTALHHRWGLCIHFVFGVFASASQHMLFCNSFGSCFSGVWLDIRLICEEPKQLQPLRTFDSLVGHHIQAVELI